MHIIRISGAKWSTREPFSASETRKALLNLVVESNLPLTFVEEPGFIRLCSLLNPTFQLTKADTMKRNIISEFFEQKRRLCYAFQMKDTGKLSATTDLWTSPNSFTIRAVTAIWLASNFWLKEATFAFRELPAGHSGENTASVFFRFWRNSV